MTPFEKLRKEWMKYNNNISLDGLPPEMLQKALGTLHVQMATSVDRETIPQNDYLSQNDLDEIFKKQTADWWLSKFQEHTEAIIKIGEGLKKQKVKDELWSVHYYLRYNEGLNDFITAIKKI